MKIGKERQDTYLRRSEKSPENTNPGLEESKASQEMNDLSEEGWRHYTENL